MFLMGQKDGGETREGACEEICPAAEGGEGAREGGAVSES